MQSKKVFAPILACLAIGPSVAWGQCATWTSSTIRNCSGIDYELWSQNNRGTVNMQITGGNTNPNGGTFQATWSGTENILFRAGKKWGASSRTTPTSIGNISLEFAATWTSSDNVKMLGIYGWAYYPAGSVPTQTERGQSTNFSNQIEYYIIQDRGNFNPGSGGMNAKKYGETTIDGIAYDFWVADRIGQPMLTGNGNFKQYFSVPKSTSTHRQSGTVSISKHFEEWDKAGMKMMDCALYEVAMKVESYTGSANGSGSANVTKNLLTLGGSSAIATRRSRPLVSFNGRTLNVSPMIGSKLQVADVNGKLRANGNAANVAVFSISSISAHR
jgi:Glycosyl hydrolases family 11